MKVNGTAFLVFLAAGGATAAPYEGVVDSNVSQAMLETSAVLATSGSLIGDYDAVDNPGGTQTRPGLFGGSGNNPIATSASISAEGQTNSNPQGSTGLNVDFETGVISFDGLSLDLLNGNTAAIGLSVTLSFSTFNTINPSFIYPGGIPITVPIADAASLTRAEFTQAGPGAGTMTATADPDVFDFTAAVPGEAALTLTVGLPGSDPLPNEVDALPLILPLAGQVIRQGDGRLRVTITASGVADAVDVPLDPTPLPTIPFELPTLGTATAGVLITLTPESLVFGGSLGVDLVIFATPASCGADVNGDGLVNFFDLAAFIDLYNAGDPAADIAPPFGVINFFDLAAFLDLYNAGCP
jgi:hypothetical protein